MLKKKKKLKTYPLTNNHFIILMDCLAWKSPAKWACLVSAPPGLKPQLGRLKGWGLESSKDPFTSTSSSWAGNAQ